MGDIVEFTDWPIHHRRTWYRVTGSALQFEVKVGSEGNSVRIGLATKPDHCPVWIVIGYHNRLSYIQDTRQNNRCEKSTQDIISSDEYRAFWLKWCNGTISFGQDGQERHIVSLKIEASYVAKLQYVSFHDQSHSRSDHYYWRVEFPPKLPPPCTRPITGGKLHWRTADGQLPDGALIGGFEKETLYIIRMEHMRSLTPGKFVPSEGVGYIAWGGSAVPSGDLEVLCGFDGIWVPTASNRIPEGAFEGGYSEVGAERLYVGRAYHNGHLIPGKVQPSHKVIYIPCDGKEIAKQKFEVLVDPNHVSRTEDRFMPLVGLSSMESDDDRSSMHDSPPSSPNYEEEAYAF